VSIKEVGDITCTVGQTRPGEQAYLDAPYGVFSLVDFDAPRLVFVAGGIGITPFISMLRYICDNQLPRQVLLIWGNKMEQDITFAEELSGTGAGMTDLEIAHVLSRQPDWAGETGFVADHLLRRCLLAYEDAECFFCGPHVMMKEVIGQLRALLVPRRRVHREPFGLR
jgi:predicted ferric reductase